MFRSDDPQRQRVYNAEERAGWGVLRPGADLLADPNDDAYLAELQELANDVLADSWLQSVWGEHTTLVLPNLRYRIGELAAYTDRTQNIFIHTAARWRHTDTRQGSAELFPPFSTVVSMLTD